MINVRINSLGVLSDNDLSPLSWSSREAVGSDKFESVGWLRAKR